MRTVNGMSRSDLEACGAGRRHVVTEHLSSHGLAFAVVTALTFAEVALGQATHAPSYPTPTDGDWLAKDFGFNTGEVMSELRLHYATVGASSGEPVVILHGTTGSSTGPLSPTFAGELFGPGQPLDATKYYIILPDAIGHGKSS